MASKNDDPLNSLRALANRVQARGHELIEAAGRTLAGDPGPPQLRGPIIAQAPPVRPSGPPTQPFPYFMTSPLKDRYDINARRPEIGQGDGSFGKDVRRYPDGRPKRHDGIDLTAPVGTEVFSAEPGTVIRADGENAKGYGNQILVRHPDGRTTRYGHLSEFDVGVGDQVGQGQRLGRSGRSGNLPEHAQPHLHFEVIEHGKPQPPDSYYDRAGRGRYLGPTVQNRLYGDG
jgi:murein DD-endopeptidase MepM/ murein hydrolase activator NlpD